MKRAFTRNQLWEMEFPVTEYSFPKESGEFVGELVMKKWSDSNGLICYFETEQQEKRKLCVWYKADSRNAYCPKKSDIDMSRVELGAKIFVQYTITAKGKTRWEQAKIL